MFMLIQITQNGQTTTFVEFNPTGEKVKAYGSFRAALHSGKVKTYRDEQLFTEMKALIQKQGVVNTMIHAPKSYTDDLIDSFVF